MSLAHRRLASIFGCLTVSIIALSPWAFGQAGVTQLGNSAQIINEYKAAEKLLGEKAKDIPKDALEKMASYWVYRVTWPSVIDAKNDKGEPMAAFHLRGFSDHLKKNNDPALINAYAPALVAKFKELFDPEKVPVVDNARALILGAQMLPIAARLQAKPIDDFLVEVIDPKTGKHDMIKLQALRAMREFDPVTIWADPFDQTDFQNKPKLAKKASELARVDALTRFILRPPPEKAKPEELEAYRYFRREAIETLGSMGAPAVMAVAQKKSLEGPIAPVLLKVLIPGAMQPEPSLQERNEAALALLAMRKMGDQGAYEPGPTYYFIGKTFVDVCKAYSADFASLNKEGRQALPWRSVGKRWEQGFANAAASATNPKDAKLANDILKRGEVLAKKMSAAKQEQVVANQYDAAINGLRPPPEFRLFKEMFNPETIKWGGDSE